VEDTKDVSGEARLTLEDQEPEEILGSLEQKIKGVESEKLDKKDVISEKGSAPKIWWNLSKYSPWQIGVWLTAAILILASVAWVYVPLWNRPPEKFEEVNAMTQTLPKAPLFGFFQKGQKLEWWIARIYKIEGNQFYLKWQGSRQTDGAGAGSGEGKGTVQSNGTVAITITESVQSNTRYQVSTISSILSGNNAPPQQVLNLEGKLVPLKSGRSYFQGTYMERGGKFYPFCSWVLGPEIPNGWKTPGNN
jgi:hypothetical protein